MNILPSRLSVIDVIRVGLSALTTRKLRTVLSALGVSIGIAALVGVLGLSASSRAGLDAQLNKLGTDLLTVEPGGALGAAGGDVTLQKDAAAMVRRIGPVHAVSSLQIVKGVNARRNRFVNKEETSGLTVNAVDLDILATLRGAVAAGHWLDSANAQYPTVVLGSVAAQRLGVSLVHGSQTVMLGEETFTVVGVLEQLPLSPDLDRAALIGIPAATRFLDLEWSPSKVYLRVSDTNQIPDVRKVLSATANPEAPDQVTVSRPSDALEAQVAARIAFNSLFLGLGAVALAVGGIGIANVMVIAVIERRGEIGLRRALGATRPHISRQFLIEAVILSGLGGVAGVGLGSAATAIYANTKNWKVVLPPSAFALGLGAAVIIGALAGLLPALRAARLAPTEALRRG
jgi:putative ABC transport system permease protein